MVHTSHLVVSRALWQELEAEKRLLQDKLVAADERRLEAEGEIRSLESAVEDAQSNAEQLKEMSR